MATASVRYPSSKERTNYARLCRAIVDLCTDVLRHVLNTIVTPDHLIAKVATCDDLKPGPHGLDAEQQKKVSNTTSTNSYSDFDITLLYKLIRAFSVQEMRDELSRHIAPSQILSTVNNCPGLPALLTNAQVSTITNSSTNNTYSKCDCLLLSLLIQHLCPTSSYCPKIRPSSNKWGGNSVRNTHLGFGDDIERVRIVRNKVYGHVSDTLVSDNDFKSHWSELDGIMKRMDARLGTSGQYQNDLSGIEGAGMDDEMEKEYVAEVKRLVETKKEIQDEIESIRLDEEKNKKDIDKNRDDIDKNRKDIDKNREDLDKNRKDIDKNREDVDKNRKDIDKNNEDADKNRKDIDKNREDVDKNRKDINKNREDVEKNRKDIDKTREDVDKNRKDIDTNLKKIGTDIKDVGEKVTKVEERAFGTGLQQEIISHWRKNDEIFSETRATQKVREAVKTNPLTVVTGAPGSVTCYHVQHMAYTHPMSVVAHVRASVRYVSDGGMYLTGGM